MINAAEFNNLAQHVFAAAKARQVEILFSAARVSLTRFAANAISHNVARDGAGYTIKAVSANKTGQASSNRLDTASLIKTLRLAEACAQSQSADPRLLPMVKGPQRYTPCNRYVERTAKLSPEERTAGAVQAIQQCQRKNLKAAGFCSNEAACLGLANNQGLFAFHQETEAVFSLTAATRDSSGWAKNAHRDYRQLDREAVCEAAIAKALSARHPQAPKPGRYTVILEAAATAEFVRFLAWLAFSPVAVQEGRSAFSGKLGRQVASSMVTLLDDAYHPLMNGLAFDYEGWPRQTVPLITNGILTRLVHNRQTARAAHTTSTGHSLPTPNPHGALPLHLVMRGGHASLQQMIAATERGLLITHFHYLNPINPKLMTLTGLTCDGLFYVRHGRLAAPVRNMRFTVSLAEVLNNIAALSRNVQFHNGVVAPAMMVHNFPFTSGTEF